MRAAAGVAVRGRRRARPAPRRRGRRAERGANADTGKAEVGKLNSQLDIEKEATARAVAQIEILNQQISALRRQIAALEDALGASENKRRRRRCTSPISASASTSRWRSACRNCRAIVRTFSASCAKFSATVPTSAWSATASCSSRKCSSTAAAAVLRPEGRAELDKLAGALLDLEKQIPSEINWVLRVDGHTDTRQLSGNSPFKSNWELSAARAISVVQYLISQGRPAAASGRRRLRRIPADRSRHHRRGVRPQPPHRAQAD